MTRLILMFTVTATLAALTGCSAQLPPAPQPLVVADRSYDEVFAAAVDVLDDRFELMVRDKDSGIISTTYRIDLLGGDSHTNYQSWESMLHMTRHCVAVNLKKSGDGSVEVLVTAYRQRQTYSAPVTEPLREANYDILDASANAPDPTALNGPQSRWENQPDNTALAQSVAKQIAHKLKVKYKG
jgi:hypothetical protein